VLANGAAGMFTVADPAGDLAEAGAAKQGVPFWHRDMCTGDGVQVEVLVQAAEDAGDQVIGTRLGCLGDGFGAGHKGSPARNGADAMLPPAGGRLAGGRHEALVVRNQDDHRPDGGERVRSCRRWR
jgi:hypothetical protein